jgi:hypothetical protein
MKTFLVCEDGAEYTERFRRFLGADFAFERATCFAEALPLCPRVAGLLLDQDFRRTDPALLVDESGARGTRSVRELATVQGTLLLRALRARGVRLPALLFADLDQPAALERELAPLQIVPADEGLAAIARRLRSL